MIVGASFDTVEEQKAFAEEQDFPYVLLADPDKTLGRDYHVERPPDMEYHEFGIPQRISYLIDPDGVIAVAYDLAIGDVELGEHSAQILADIAARS